MAKDKDKKAKKSVEVNMDLYAGKKCFKKINGGSHRFPNRIIKPGQNFWIEPDRIQKAFKDVFQEIPADYNAVIVGETSSAEKFKVPAKKENKNPIFEKVVATDKDGETLKKGNAVLYNVIDETGKPLNEKPMREAKADELLESLIGKKE